VHAEPRLVLWHLTAAGRDPVGVVTSVHATAARRQLMERFTSAKIALRKEVMHRIARTSSS
jgi:hypothetical protein